MPSLHLFTATAIAGATLAIACNALIGIADVPAAADAAAAPSEGGGGGDENAPPAEASSAMDSGDAGMAMAQDATSDVTNESAASEGGLPCTDTQGDMHNCGVCNHDCLGGSCIQGHCQPFPLVGPDAGIPYGLAQDGTYLYWTDEMNYAVNRSSKTTGATLRMTGATSQPFPVVYDDGGAGVVFWGDLTGIHYCPASGCPVVPPTAITTPSGARVTALAVDSASVYWTTGGPEVRSAPKFGNKETGTALWDGDASAVEMATDGRQVYFTASDGVLHAVGVDGGAGSTASWGSPMSASSWGLALFGGAVYWTLADPGNGHVYGASATSPSLSVSDLADNQPTPSFLATDGTSIYWTDNPVGSGSILRCEIASCVPTVLAQQNSYEPAALLVDDVAIYWSDNGTNATIWKQAK